MRKVLALDLSSKPGYACFADEKLVEYGTLFPDVEISKNSGGAYPHSFIWFAKYTAQRVLGVAISFASGESLEVVIEETTSSKNCYSQKILEFIHFSVIEALSPIATSFSYIRTGVWRQELNVVLNPDDKAINARIARLKRTQKAKYHMAPGRMMTKKTRKHASIREFNRLFGTRLLQKMEDAAEAALIGLAYLRGVPTCDGTPHGGLFRKELVAEPTPPTPTEAA